MERIKTPTRVPDKFGPGRDGFANGNPQTGAPSTQLEADWFDFSQEEICRQIERAGITVGPGGLGYPHDQLAESIRLSVAGYLPLTGGNLYRPGASDPLIISSDAGQRARITYGVAGGRFWGVGAEANGAFTISDEATGPKLTLDFLGNMFGTALNLSGGLTAAAVTSTGTLNVTGNADCAQNLFVAGNITGTTHLNISGNITGSSDLSLPGGNVYCGNQIFAANGMFPASSTTPDFVIGQLGPGPGVGFGNNLYFLYRYIEADYVWGSGIPLQYAALLTFNGVFTCARVVETNPLLDISKDAIRDLDPTEIDFDALRPRRMRLEDGTHHVTFLHEELREVSEDLAPIREVSEDEIWRGIHPTGILAVVVAELQSLRRRLSALEEGAGGGGRGGRSHA